MSQFIQTTGIVIGKRDFLEADKIITLLTPDLGKIEIKAKGARKMLAKLNSHLELFTYTNVTLVKGRTWYVVTGAQTIEAFHTATKDFERLGYMYYMAELIQALVTDEVDAEDVYRETLQLLRYLESDGRAATVALLAFEAQLWRISGIHPEIQQCVSCRVPLAGQPMHYSAARGGFLCLSHGETAGVYQAIDGRELKVMRLLFNQPFEIIQKVRLEPEVLQGLRMVFDLTLEHFLGRRLKSRQFIGSGGIVSVS